MSVTSPGANPSADTCADAVSAGSRTGPTRSMNALPSRAARCWTSATPMPVSTSVSPSGRSTSRQWATRSRGITADS